MSGNELTSNEAALIYCIIGSKNGRCPTVEESLAIFNPEPVKKAARNIDDALEMLNSEQMTLF